jgi:predicted membrane channel-forming protein YqfA (hemolysin III family)
VPGGGSVSVRPPAVSGRCQRLIGAHGKFCNADDRRHRPKLQGETMTLLIYLVGWIIFIGGVAWGLTALHVAQHVIAIVAVILFGIAVITGATRARNRDRS